RHEERSATEQASDREGTDVLRDLVADEEPLHHRADAGTEYEQEREAVATLILLERLRAERTEQPADAVRDAQPHAHGDRRLLGLVDVALGSRRRLAGRGSPLGCGLPLLARRRCVFRARGLRGAPRHASTLRPS